MTKQLADRYALTGITFPKPTCTILKQIRIKLIVIGSSKAFYAAQGKGVLVGLIQTIASRAHHQIATGEAQYLGDAWFQTIGKPEMQEITR